MNNHALFLWGACVPALLLVIAEAVLVCLRLKRARTAASQAERRVDE
jgi:cytochrome c-type biogenesis protein CcmH/NrfF